MKEEEEGGGIKNSSPVGAPEPDRRWYTPLRFLATFHFETPPIRFPIEEDIVKTNNEPLQDTTNTPLKDINKGKQHSKMAPPSYVDLGKQARDLFGRGYHYGYWKLDCKTKTQSGIEFNTGGQTNTESGKVFGSLETKYKLPDAGVTLSEKWTTDNALFTEVSVQDKLVEGLKLAAVSSFVPHTGSVNAKFKMAYGQEYFKMDADMNLDYRPLINLQAVLGYEGFLLGYQTAFDTEHTKMTTNNFAVGYAAKDFVVHSVVNNGEEFIGSIFHKVSDKLDVGVQLSWLSESNNTKFGLGTKLQLDKEAALRAKVNNACQIGLGYQQKLRDGITLFLSTMIDCKNFNSGGHKIGVALELEA